MSSTTGILLVDKEPNTPSFKLVSLLRRATGIEKIGHAGTLDPFATGVMVMLIGRDFTRRSDEFLNSDKEYIATLQLGTSTDTYDIEGQITERKERIPTAAEIAQAIALFQGEVLQTPPMYCAKKIGGKKLYELARKGIVVERKPSLVRMAIEQLSYDYPHLTLRVACSKGTYIRSLAHDMGQALQCGAHLSALQRTRSGPFLLADCIPQNQLHQGRGSDLISHLRTHL